MNFELWFWVLVILDSLVCREFHRRRHLLDIYSHLGFWPDSGIRIDLNLGRGGFRELVYFAHSVHAQKGADLEAAQ